MCDFIQFSRNVPKQPMAELRTMLGASTIGIREAIRRLVELGLVRRELTGNPRTPIRYVVIDKAED